jgi:signal transduction histidine kinase
MWLVVGVLVVLLALLAALQYHWTGEIGRAEGDRQRTRLERASQRFARELGRELGQTMMAFRPEFRGRDPMDPRPSLLERLERWGTTEHAGLVSRLVLVTLPESGPPTAEAADAERLEFGEVPFPPQLEPFRQQLADPEKGRFFRGGFRPDGFLSDPPAFLMPVIQPGGEASPRFGPGAFQLSGVAVIELSEAYLGEVLLPDLAEIHFGPLDQGDYAVAVLRRKDDSLLYSSDPDLAPDELARPDVRLELSAWPGWPGSPGERFDRGFHVGGRPPMGDGMPGRRSVEPPDGSRPAISQERGLGDRSSRPWRDGSAQARQDGPGTTGGPWVLVVRHRGGSLAAAVAAVRRRNLGVGFGVLALLGVAAALLAVGAQRARNLARQQLEFVAGVTHELHTPLAAIRSAGQNLADGVVSDPQQIARYGDLIQKEGSRLSALVAQVLEFAGIESGSRVYSTEPVPLGPLVARVVGNLSLVLEQAGMTVDVDVPDNLPEVRGDVEALGRALENLLTNAAKFAPGGGWVGVSAAPGPGAESVELRVKDRGPGIPRAERGRIFEPFYRGRDARRNQSPGSGLGLSLVHHVAEAHGGRVRVEAGDEGGTTVVMELPAGTKRLEESA